MADTFHRITNWLDHHRHTALGLTVAGAAGVWLIGCEVTTTSLVDPQRDVTRQQLEAEIRSGELELRERGHLLDKELADYRAAVERFEDAAGAGLDGSQGATTESSRSCRQRTVKWHGRADSSVAPAAGEGSFMLTLRDRCTSHPPRYRHAAGSSRMSAERNPEHGEKDTRGRPRMADAAPTRETIDRIKDIIKRDLMLGSDVELADDEPLFGGEHDLDSLDALLLVSSIEKAFGIKIASESIGREVFESVATLAAFIESAQSDATHA